MHYLSHFSSKYSVYHRDLHSFPTRRSSDLHDRGEISGKASLSLVERRALKPGDFYTLLPPEGDIHRVRTTSSVPSISIHLLGSDLGCVLRHAYDLPHGMVHDFRSGYANVKCENS